jgi:hypothetical protein
MSKCLNNFYTGTVSPNLGVSDFLVRFIVMCNTKETYCTKFIFSASRPQLHISESMKALISTNSSYNWQILFQKLPVFLLHLNILYNVFWSRAEIISWNKKSQRTWPHLLQIPNFCSFIIELFMSYLLYLVIYFHNNSRIILHFLNNITVQCDGFQLISIHLHKSLHHAIKMLM